MIDSSSFQRNAFFILTSPFPDCKLHFYFGGIMDKEAAEIINLKFLVADDDLSLRKVVRHQLNTLGVVKLSEANNGRDALQLLEKGINSIPFDFIISDWNMPSLSGLELLKKCRNHNNPSIKNIAFMLVTSESEASQVKEAITAGVDQYIVKPVRQENLEEKLRLVYRKRFQKK